MRRRLWLLLCALGVLGTAACGAGESKANAAAKSEVVRSSAAAATGEASKAEEKESESSAAKTAATEPAAPASTAESTASETAAVTERHSDRRLSLLSEQPLHLRGVSAGHGRASKQCGRGAPRGRNRADRGRKQAL